MIMPRSCLYLLFVAIIGLVCSGSLHAATPQKGDFLVADKDIADPRFRDRTIFLIQHDAKGSAGLVIDRPSRLPVASVLGEDSKLSAQKALLSYGGPVEPKTILALVKVKNHPPEPSDEVLPSLYVTGAFVLDEWPEFDEETVAYRVFAGYAGWAPGQLEAELKREDWRIEPSDEEALFAGDDVSEVSASEGKGQE